MRTMHPHRFVKGPARVDDVGDHHGIERYPKLVVTGYERLADELVHISARIDDGDDCDCAVDGRQHRDFGEIRLAREHEVLETTFLGKRKGLRAVRPGLPEE